MARPDAGHSLARYRLEAPPGKDGFGRAQPPGLALGARLGGVTSSLAAQKLSYAEYLELERTSETKHEYVNGEVLAMSGGSPEHARLQARMVRVLGAALAGEPCEPFTSDLRVRIESTGRATYPDVTVICGAIARASDDHDAVTNPTVLVEVLSDSTESADRGDKWAHYQRIASLQHYVLVSQKEPRIEVFTRETHGWHYDDVREGRVELRSLGISLAIDEIYRSALQT